MPLVCIIFAPEKKTVNSAEEYDSDTKTVFLHWCNQVYGVHL